MLNLDKIPDQVGYLKFNDRGVLASGGEVVNDEYISRRLYHMVSMADKIDPVAFQPGEGVKRISVMYKDFYYVICLSNKNFYVVKRKVAPIPVEHVVA